MIRLEETPIHVVRLGYRLGRDPRITTHLGLVSRAWGAQYFHVFGDEDSKLFSTIQQVNQRFGGLMECHHQKGLMRWMKNFQDPNQTNGVIVHLTMYGQNYKEVVSEIESNRPIAIIVGGAKVPGEVFKISDFNASVGTQPHSEVAALALFLDQLNTSRNSVPMFVNPELIIEPSADGKIVHSMKDFEEE